VSYGRLLSVTMGQKKIKLKVIKEGGESVGGASLDHPLNVTCCHVIMSP
jgi:hypothetical protein